VIVASITESITSFIGDHGVYAVFLLMMIDAVFPAASELVMVYGGALAAGAFANQHVILFGHQIDSAGWAYVTIALAGTLGYLVGALIGWAIGHYGGRPLLDRHGHWFHLTPARLEQAERWFDRHGDAAVLVGRIVPVVRSFISIPAGVFRVPLGRYTVLTLIGSAIWCFLLAGIGWAVGKSWSRFHHEFRWADYAVAALVVAGVVWLVLRMRRSRLARRADTPR
jgi:membrane protein DedA with SNARE-associated domain